MAETTAANSTDREREVTNPGAHPAIYCRAFIDQFWGNFQFSASYCICSLVHNIATRPALCRVSRPFSRSLGPSVMDPIQSIVFVSSLPLVVFPPRCPLTKTSLDTVSPAVLGNKHETITRIYWLGNSRLCRLGCFTGLRPAQAHRADESPGGPRQRRQSDHRHFAGGIVVRLLRDT